MDFDKMAPRESIDSIESSSPFIPIHQPPPPEIANQDDFGNEASDHRKSIKIKLSLIIILCRIPAFISGLAAGITFAIIGARRDEVQALIACTWFALAWNAIPLIRVSYKPFFSISLVLDGGKVVRLDSLHDDEVVERRNSTKNGGDREKRRRRWRRCLFSGFWIDLALTVAVFSLNLIVSLRWENRYNTALALNWVAM